MTLTHLQKLPKNVRDLDKLIVSKGFKKLPKVQKIAQSGHTGCGTENLNFSYLCGNPTVHRNRMHQM